VTLRADVSLVPDPKARIIVLELEDEKLIELVRKLVDAQSPIPVNIKNSTTKSQ